MVDNRKILHDANEYVTAIFNEKIEDRFAFHNLDHTHFVLKACREIAHAYALAADELLILELAAYFHDSGYSGNDLSDHEKTSAEIAAGFLQMYQVPEETIAHVTACIQATRMPQQPHTLTEQILCDADLFHLGTDQFPEKTKLLRREYVEACGQQISKSEWRKRNIKFLQEHEYFTSYCRQKLNQKKQENLQKLLAKDGKHEGNEIKKTPDIHEESVKHERSEAHELPEVSETKKKPDTRTEAETPKKKPANERTERGITTMFRIMSSNHNDLSGMADSKANIMISVNSIIISILVSVLLGRLSYYTNLIIPTILLIASSLAAIIFAILATRPKVSSGRFTTDDIKNKKINLLFFGSFYNMKLDDYNWAMNEMMNDRSYLYDSMLKDIYYLGVVLARKYKYLRISYNIFMYGLVVSMLAFAIAMFFPSQVSSIP